MYSSNLFTFKTRRKYGVNYILLATLFVIGLTYPVEGLLMPCPENCDCFISQPDNLKSASCTQISSNLTIYPNIRLLKIIPRAPLEKCVLPEDSAAKIFPNLLFLNLSNCKLSQVSGSNFKHFKNILNIDLSHNQITGLDRFTFSSNRLLRYVSLEGNAILGLHLNHSPILESNSIDELNLASCNLDKLPLNMFKALPNLRHLTMSNNQLKTLKDNSLPDKLRTLDLSKNKIVNVPTDELNRLQLLTQINLSENPVNCTCALIGFQNWVSGKGVIFVSNIKCAYPAQYQGHKLINLPPYELCDAKVDGETIPSECSRNQICFNRIIRENGYMGDQPAKDKNLEVFKQDEVIPVTNESLDVVIGDTMQNDGSGCGSDECTAIPDIINSTTTPSTRDSSLNKAGVIKVDYELSSITTLEPSSSSIQSFSDTAKPDVVSVPVSFSKAGVNVEVSQTSSLEPDSSLVQSSSETPKTNDSSTSASSSEAAVNLEVSPTTILEPDSSSVHSYSETPKLENTCDPGPTCDIALTLAVDPTIASESSSSSVLWTSETPKTVDTSVLASSNESTSNYEVSPTTISELLSSSSGISSIVTPGTENTSAFASISKAAKVLSETPINESTETRNNFTGELSHAKLQTSSSGIGMVGYVVPVLTVLLVGLICIAVYCSQYLSSVKRYKRPDESGNDEGSELQQVSLLPGKSQQPAIIKSNGESSQSERLLNDLDKSNLQEVNSNGSYHANETVDSCNKLPNGHSKKENGLQCTVAKVTTIPESVPKTPIIRNL